MPRLRTNKSAAKRFKRTGGSTIKCKQTNRRHLLTSKNRKRKRNLRGTNPVDAVDLRSVKRLLRVG